MATADDSQQDELSIAGIDLEHAPVYSDAEQMREEKAGRLALLESRVRKSFVDF